jgi:hypothetical protein
MVAYPQAGFRLLCFPGVVLLSRGGRRAGNPYRWKHCTPTFLFFLHFRPRCVIWTSVAADILSALCWGSVVKPRPLFHCSLLFIVTLWMRFSLLCLFLLPCWWTRFELVLYTKWLFSYQTGFSPLISSSLYGWHHDLIELLLTFGWWSIMMRQGISVKSLQGISNVTSLISMAAIALSFRTCLLNPICAPACL